LSQAAGRVGDPVYGDDYVLLGYLPGEESALRRMVGGLAVAFPKDYVRGKETGQYSLLQRAHGLGDIDLAVVVANDRVHVRRWLEQIQAPVGLPMAAVVSAGVEPALSSYYQSGQLLGLLGGFPGTAEYEALRQRRGVASETADAQALAYLVIILAGLLGNAAHALGRRGSETSGAGSAPLDSGEHANG